MADTPEGTCIEVPRLTWCDGMPSDAIFSVRHRSGDSLRV